MSDDDRAALTAAKPDVIDLIIWRTLRADVLALVQARGYPDLVVDELRLSGQKEWRAMIGDCEWAALVVLRDALLAAQRRDGPRPSGEIAV